MEQLWARRKVGFLLDQIRANGEKKELVEEVVSLAKKYGITTPYTSYLVVPDGPMPVVRDPRMRPQPRSSGCRLRRYDGRHGQGRSPGRTGSGGTDELRPSRYSNSPSRTSPSPATWPINRGHRAEKDLSPKRRQGRRRQGPRRSPRQEGEPTIALGSCSRRRAIDGVQAGKLGVDLSVQMQNLRNQTRLEQTALRNVYGRNCLEVGGVWIDEGFDAKMKTARRQGAERRLLQAARTPAETQGGLQARQSSRLGRPKRDRPRDRYEQWQGETERRGSSQSLRRPQVSRPRQG